jgi:hypothetical protein
MHLLQSFKARIDARGGIFTAGGQYLFAHDSKPVLIDVPGVIMVAPLVLDEHLVILYDFNVSKHVGIVVLLFYVVVDVWLL